MKLVLEFDDFHWRSPENCIHSIQFLISACPAIRLSFFTIPLLDGLRLSDDAQWCDAVLELIKCGNVRLAVHGLTHSYLEFRNLQYDAAMERLDLAGRQFELADLPYTKVFKGPNWGINNSTYDALAKLGYTHVYGHTEYIEVSKANSGKVTTIFYNWNLKDERPEECELVIAHGHTHDVCDNGIAKTVGRTLRFIENHQPEFLFVDEV